MRFVFFLIVIFLVSCVYCRYFDAERDEALRDSAVPHEKAEDDETEQQLEDTKNVDDKPNLEKVAQRVGNEKRRFRSYFYNYLDEMAMSICATIPSPRAGAIFAVRRTCSVGSPTCNQICNGTFLFTYNKAGWIKQKEWICLESLHVYKNRPVLKDNFVAYTDSYKLGLQVYRYHSCNSPSCGPNYCCCQFN